MDTAMLWENKGRAFTAPRPSASRGCPWATAPCSPHVCGGRAGYGEAYRDSARHPVVSDEALISELERGAHQDPEAESP